ncbi:hypothetical protein AZZ94_002525 [Enterobacter hormaechei]|nr:hypothetical protein AZZ94_002525 [Enterobacter hormaechei]
MTNQEPASILLIDDHPMLRTDESPNDFGKNH